MDPLWISTAFLLGFAVRQIGLPPLVGFLLAGFALKALGVEGGPFLRDISDLGVTLLLFTIGLKFKVKSLLQPEIWAGTTLHMAITVLLFGGALGMLSGTGIALFAPLDFKLALLIAFALSFSSTVFAVKVLENKAELASFHGRVAIGILIMQDILAVIFLTVSTGKFPSLWALALIPLFFILRPVMMRLMEKSGHGELMILFGLFLALVIGAGGCELVGLKRDLGALIIGIMVANHPKAGELANHLMGFKDLFLVGFFLSIGLSAEPTWGALGVGALLAAVMPLKVVLFFLLLTRFKLRARTATLGALSLANYSEFGLIVASLAAGRGWIDSGWLVTIAIALSLTFILAAPLNTHAQAIYNRNAAFLKRFETRERHIEDTPIDPGDAEIAIFGMGRIGTSAYDTMVEHHGNVVIGVDFCQETVERQKATGRNVILGDPTDPDFWERATPEEDAQDRVKMMILAMPKHAANLAAAKFMRKLDFNDVIVTTANYEDQVAELEKAGVNGAFDFRTEAGIGLAEEAHQILEEHLLRRPHADSPDAG
ncbi:MAG: cation:proton antiporter [Desulfobacterales bacterium]|nr:cation:proton antiporter [Desulfobacterales bacterium]